MVDHAFEYKGCRVDIEIEEAGNESSSGVFYSTIRMWPDARLNQDDAAVILERRAAHIFVSAQAAFDAAAARARQAIDVRQR